MFELQDARRNAKIIGGINMDQVQLITSNHRKYEMAKEVFQPEIDLGRSDVEVDEVQSTNPRKVVEKKAVAAYEKEKRPLIVDDFSFFLTGLGDFPGPLVKHLLKETGLKGLKALDTVAEDGCKIVCSVMFHDGDGFVDARGELPGTLELDSKHADPEAKLLLSTVFVPDGCEKPLCEAEIDNHRHRAYRNLKKKMVDR